MTLMLTFRLNLDRVKINQHAIITKLVYKDAFALLLYALL